MKFNRHKFPREFERWAFDKEHKEGGLRILGSCIYIRGSSNYYLAFGNFNDEWNTFTHDTQDRILGAINALLKTDHEFI